MTLKEDFFTKNLFKSREEIKRVKKGIFSNTATEKKGEKSKITLKRDF